jgi:hypothetical protein
MSTSIDIVDAQKRLRATAATRQGERLRFALSREQVILQHRLGALDATSPVTEEADAESDTSVPVTVISSPYPPCVLPYAALQKTCFRELLLETHHRGKYVLVRVVAPPRKDDWIGSVVEDEAGDAMPLYLFNQLTGHAMLDREEMIMPVDRVLVIKEPYVNLVSEDLYGIRVDHISDVVWLAADDIAIPERWRSPVYRRANDGYHMGQEGTAAFKSGDYREAVIRYVFSSIPTNKVSHSHQLRRLC